MKFYQAVNVDALNASVDALFGANMVPTVGRVYNIIDAQMRSAFNAGVTSVAPPAPQYSAMNADPVDTNAVNEFQKLIEKDSCVVDLKPNSVRLDMASLMGDDDGAVIQRDSGDETD